MATYVACTVSELINITVEGEVFHAFNLVSKDSAPVLNFAYTSDEAARAARDQLAKAIIGARITRPQG